MMTHLSIRGCVIKIKKADAEGMQKVQQFVKRLKIQKINKGKIREVKMGREISVKLVDFGQILSWALQEIYRGH